MFSRLPNELKRLKKSNVSINEVLRYYDESRNRKHKLQAKKIWINKRKKIREELHLDKENEDEEEAAFNRNLKKLAKKKEQLRKEEEFNKKKRQITKQYKQKQRDDLKPGKEIRYRESRSWKNRNNKTKKSRLSKQYYPSTDKISLEHKNSENKDSIFVEAPKKGAGKKTRKQKRSRKKKQTRKKNKRRRKRKTRRKSAGKPTFIKQSKINKGIQGCNTLHRISEVHKCRNMGGLENYNKKKMIGKIHLPYFNRPHLPHFKKQTEKNNEKLANMEWGDMGFGKQ